MLQPLVNPLKTKMESILNWIPTYTLLRFCQNMTDERPGSFELDSINHDVSGRFLLHVSTIDCL